MWKNYKFLIMLLNKKKIATHKGQNMQIILNGIKWK